MGESNKAVARMAEICKTAEMQKLVFLEQVKARFRLMEDRIIALEDRIRVMLEGEEAA